MMTLLSLHGKVPKIRYTIFSYLFAEALMKDQVRIEEAEGRVYERISVSTWSRPSLKIPDLNIIRMGRMNASRIY